MGRPKVIKVPRYPNGDPVMIGDEIWYRETLNKSFIGRRLQVIGLHKRAGALICKLVDSDDPEQKDMIFLVLNHFERSLF